MMTSTKPEKIAAQNDIPKRVTKKTLQGTNKKKIEFRVY